MRVRPGELTYRQQAFVQEYLTDRNAVQAAARAGYACTKSQGSRLLKMPAIVAAIREHDQRLESQIAMDREAACQILARIARGKLADFLQANGEIDLDKVRRAGQELEQYVDDISGDSRRRRIKLRDPVRALELLGKFLGWEAARKLELSGQGVGPVYIQIVEHK
jgi:phage terminase small subunit